MDVSVRRQFKGKIFGFRKISESFIAQVNYQAKLNIKNQKYHIGKARTPMLFSQAVT